MTRSPQEIARVIDHTILKPDAPESAIRQLCAEARHYGFASVCVHPCWVHTVSAELEDSGVAVCTVIGFPHGANTSEVKAFETSDAIRNGATELDMVINIGAVKSGAWAVVKHDIEGVTDLAGDSGASVKVIIECALLTDEEKEWVTEIVAASGAAFVKTSTGFASHGAIEGDVRLLKTVAKGRCEVKASGGIRDLPTLISMLDAGATRIGTSAGVAIMQAAAQSE